MAIDWDLLRRWIDQEPALIFGDAEVYARVKTNMDEARLYTPSPRPVLICPHERAEACIFGCEQYTGEWSARCPSGGYRVVVKDSFGRRFLGERR